MATKQEILTILKTKIFPLFTHKSLGNLTSDSNVSAYIMKNLYSNFAGELLKRFPTLTGKNLTVKLNGSVKTVGDLIELIQKSQNPID